MGRSEVTKNFDQNIYIFPESWQELRKELFTHWNPKHTGLKSHHYLCDVRWDRPECGWAMAFDADLFVEYMNGKLKGVYKVLTATNDKEFQIGHICKIFLTELRRIRGEPNP